MARHTPGNYVPLDVNYPRDRAIRKAGPDAELLYVRGLAYAKGARTDGLVPDYDLEVAAAGLRNVRRSVSRLVAERLWIKVDGGWQIRSWMSWNKPAAEEVAFQESQGQHGSKGNHERWHASRGITSPDCPHCSDPTPQPDRLPDPEPDRGGESPIREGKGREGKNTSASADAERAADLDADFDEWYALFPRKRDRGHAVKAYKAARKEVGRETLLATLRQQLPELEERNPEKRPYPATWLRGQRWLDEPDNVRSLPVRDAGPVEVFHPPEPPEEIAMDGAAYLAWVQEERRKWDERRASR